MEGNNIGHTGHVSQAGSVNGAHASQSTGFRQPGMFGPRNVITVPPNNHLVVLLPPGPIHLQIANRPMQIHTTVTTTYMPAPLNPRSGQILFDRGVATLMQSKGYSISEAADMSNRGMQWAQANFGYDYSLAESKFMGWINGAPHRADNVSASDDAATALPHEGRDEESFMEDDLLTVDLSSSEDDEHIYAQVPEEKDDDSFMLASSSQAQPTSPNTRMAVLAEQKEYAPQGQQPLDQAGSEHSGPDKLTSDAHSEYQSLVEDRELLGVSSTYNDLGVAKGAFRKLLAHSSDLSWSRKIINAAKKYLSFEVGKKALLKEPDPDQLKALGELNLDASASERSIRLALINEASSSLETNEVTLHENRMKELDTIHNILFDRG